MCIRDSLETETQGDINGDGKITYIMCKGDPENIDAQYRTCLLYTSRCV